VYNGNYQHWGTNTSAGPAPPASDQPPPDGSDDGTTASSPLPRGLLEPNNLVPPEECAVSHMELAYGGAGGWADTRCDMQHVFICKLQGETPDGGLAVWSLGSGRHRW
jgi:hypothetical protein